MENAFCARTILAPVRCMTPLRIFRFFSMSASSTTKQGVGNSLKRILSNQHRLFCSSWRFLTVINQYRIKVFYPRKSPFVQLFHEWIRIKLLNIVYAWFVPFAGQNHSCADHGRNACCIRDRLGADFFKALLVVANIVHVVRFIYAVFFCLGKCSRCLFYQRYEVPGMPDQAIQLSETGAE